MIYPRLQLARNLLTDDGVICISIDDNEIENLRRICNEIYGEDNFIACFIIVRSEGGGLAKRAVIGHDYMIVYAKDSNKFTSLGKPKDIRGKIIIKDDEAYWIETDWFREVFGKYGTCHYEDILKFYDQKKKDEIDCGIKNGSYVLIERSGKRIVGRYRKIADDTSKFYTIIKHLNKNGVADLISIGLETLFDFPKPISLIRDFIQGATILSKNNNDIILDFFSGSATTAHAVMQLNAEDGGNRKFIMVQLPEVCTSDSEAAKAGYSTICEIGKERIRRAGAKIMEEQKAKNNGLFAEDAKPLDTGFRVFKLDSTNMKDVYYAAGQLSQKKLWDTVSNIKEDRSDIDLLYGCLLDWGVYEGLQLPHTTEKIEDFTVHTVDSPQTDKIDLIACFDSNISETLVRVIAARKPMRALFRDSSFADSANKINVFEIFKSVSFDTSVEVI